VNLIQIRQKFRDLSGRYDLVGVDGSDSGADFFIQTGQQWLDRKTNTQKSEGIVFRLIQPGNYFTTFQYARAIKEVWAATAASGRWQLSKVDIQDLKVNYADMWSNLDVGSPLSYAPASLRTIPNQDRLGIDGLEAIIGFTDVMTSSSYGYNGVIILPPPDVVTHLEIWGQFYSMPLESDLDVSFWSVSHPDILIMAAMRQVEVFNRNTQGRQDWELAVDQMLSDMDKDIVDEDLPDLSEMEG
jgi:hypothetical protein